MKMLKYILGMIIFLNIVNFASAENLIYDLSTPEKSLNSLIKSLQTGNLEEVKKVTTKKGIDSLSVRFGPEKSSDRILEIGKIWSSSEIRWAQRKENFAQAFFGPQIKEQSFEFLQTKEGWKLDKWSPGE